MNNGVLMKVRNLKKYFDAETKLFRKSKRFVHAVDDISFSIEEGNSLGLVGESGCGKTTTGRIIVRLEKPTSGEVILKGKNAVELDKSQELGYHKQVQMIFQDPYESLNPRMTISEIVAEPLIVHALGTRHERQDMVEKSLNEVGISPAQSFLLRYPHELSGGQKQRVAIARALILDPMFVVADEPTSMLDVSVRAGVMELMLELQNKHKMSYLYITHDLAVARYMCNRIAVMYLGKIVELGDTEDILARPLHPYTKALLSAVSTPNPGMKRDEPRIKGGIGSPVDPPPECRFFERCPIATDYCEKNPHPPLGEVRTSHFVSCYVAAGDAK